MPAKNELHYGDNLEVLTAHPAWDGQIDLIYLDPPFNSNRSYNVLFGKSKGVAGAQAQIQAFDDTWTWSPEVAQHYHELTTGGLPLRASDALEAMHKLLGESDVLAYMVMMTPRLVQLHRKLKDTGSLYLHCDPAASHYLKIMLDAIFGPDQFRNEIIWRRTGAHGKVKRYAPTHDVILFYTKTDDYKWRAPTKAFMQGHVDEYFVKDERGWRTNYYGNVLTGSGLRGGESGKPWKGIDPSAKGRHWAIPGALVDDLDEDLSAMTQHQKLDRLLELGHIKIIPGQAWPMYERYITPKDGTPAPDIWTYQPYTEGTVFESDEGIDADVRWLSPRDSERLGYQTQKPVGLLKRIIAASTDPGDVVLDPFCGCGTTIEAAQELDRHWLGIDITYISIDLIQKRLRGRYGDTIAATFTTDGIPRDMEGAHALFAKSPFDFERWAVSLVDATPNERQVGDRGIDGVAQFPLDNKDGKGKAIVSVKGGALNPAMVRDLLGTVEAQKAEMGILVSLERATRGVTDAAAHSGNFTATALGRSYPRVQVISIEELLAGKKPNMPTPFLPYIRSQRSFGEEQLTMKFDAPPGRAAREPRRLEAVTAAPVPAAPAKLVRAPAKAVPAEEAPSKSVAKPALKKAARPARKA